MNPKYKSILAVAAGILTGAIVIFLIQLFSPHQPPKDLDINDKTQLRAWIDTLPLQAFIIVLLSYFLGSVAGGFITNFLANTSKYRPALVTGFGLFVVGVMNLVAIPHPIWFAVVSSLLYFFGAWIGGRLASNSLRAKPSR
jgi:zinc transporter ZupT